MTDAFNFKKSWTKWERGVTKGAEIDKWDKDWTCQACGETQPKEIDPYVFPVGPRMFVRVCPICQARIVQYHIYNSINALVRACRYRLFENFFAD